MGTAFTPSTTAARMKVCVPPQRVRMLASPPLAWQCAVPSRLDASRHLDASGRLDASRCLDASGRLNASGRRRRISAWRPGRMPGEVGLWHRLHKLVGRFAYARLCAQSACHSFSCWVVRLGNRGRGGRGQRDESEFHALQMTAGVWRGRRIQRRVDARQGHLHRQGASGRGTRRVGQGRRARVRGRLPGWCARRPGGWHGAGTECSRSRVGGPVLPSDARRVRRVSPRAATCRGVCATHWGKLLPCHALSCPRLPSVALSPRSACTPAVVSREQ